MTTMYMMVGLPGSGKSTVAAELAKKTGAVIHSSDKLREELFGDINSQIDNNALFAELHKRIIKDLQSGKSVIFDATNINSKKRGKFLYELRKVNCRKECKVVVTPYETCLERNNMRDRIVPEEAIKRMYMNWETPYYFEGWDSIEVIHNDIHTYRNIPMWIFSVSTFDQKNPNHSATLGQHCEETGNYLIDKTNKKSLVQAGYLHDLGKPFTMTFMNKKGEVGTVAHYYQHHCVGAYNSLFFATEDPLYVSVLINYHMHPFFWNKDVNGDKAKANKKRLWGDALYNDIILLHEADRKSH